jgi:hypothetical protein
MMEDVQIRIIHRGVLTDIDREDGESVINRLSVKFRFLRPGDVRSQTREKRFFLAKWDKHNNLVNHKLAPSLAKKIEEAPFPEAERAILSFCTKQYGDEFSLQLDRSGNPQLEIWHVMKMAETEVLATPLEEKFAEALGKKEEMKKKKTKKIKE